MYNSGTPVTGDDFCDPKSLLCVVDRSKIRFCGYFVLSWELYCVITPFSSERRPSALVLNIHNTNADDLALKVVHGDFRLPLTVGTLV